MARSKSSEPKNGVSKTRARKPGVFAVSIEGSEGTEVKLVQAMTKKAAKAAVIGKITVEIATPQMLLQAGADGQDILSA